MPSSEADSSKGSATGIAFGAIAKYSRSLPHSLCESSMSSMASREDMSSVMADSMCPQVRSLICRLVVKFRRPFWRALGSSSSPKKSLKCFRRRRWSCLSQKKSQTRVLTFARFRIMLRRDMYCSRVSSCSSFLFSRRDIITCWGRPFLLAIPFSPSSASFAFSWSAIAIASRLARSGWGYPLPSQNIFASHLTIGDRAW
mmetsp:Transcript_46334/g.145303  ORF Transcript_46334/g.145303 Transcript_46334/m.145303 type:complete len:200 (-) Transcript_46334:568-1167(-)